jgi:hypothetical protein
MWHWIIEKRNSHGIFNGHFSTDIRQHFSILKRSHSVEPRFGCAVDETAIDPCRHLINLHDEFAQELN